jgi:hypothetical protein
MKHKHLIYVLAMIAFSSIGCVRPLIEPCKNGILCEIIVTINNKQEREITDSVMVYWDGSYLWKAGLNKYFTKQRFYRGKVPEDIFMVLNKSVRSSKEFKDKNGVPEYEHNLADSISPSPGGVGELLSFLRLEHSFEGQVIN